MFIEMAVIVITIVAEMKTVGETGQVFYRPPDPHDLQGLFAGNACGGFKITLQSAGADAISAGQGFDGY